MQVNKNQIQRPSLIEPFFDKELTPDNDYVTYIDCSTNSSSVVHKKSVTPDSHNIKKALKTENHHRYIDNPLVKICPVFSHVESNNYFSVHSNNSCLLFIKPDLDKHKDYYKLHDDFSIFHAVA